MSKPKTITEQQAEPGWTLHQSGKPLDEMNEEERAEYRTEMLEVAETTRAERQEEKRQSRWQRMKAWFQDHPDVRASPEAPPPALGDEAIWEKARQNKIAYDNEVAARIAAIDAKIQASVEAAILAKKNGTWVEPVKEVDPYAHLPKCQLDGCKIPITGTETTLISRNGDDLFQRSICPGCEKKLFEMYRAGHKKDLQSNPFAKPAVFFTITNGSKGYGRPATARQGE